MELVLPNHLLEPLNTLTVIKGDWHPVYFYIGKKKDAYQIVLLHSSSHYPTELIEYTIL